MPTNITPLTNIPVTTVVDGVEIRGVVEAVWPNDMVVVITSPVDTLRTFLHVPSFAMYPCNRLATTCATGRTIAMTERGRQRAESLLQELYAASQGRGSGWGIEVIGEKREEGGTV